VLDVASVLKSPNAIESVLFSMLSGVLATVTGKVNGKESHEQHDEREKRENLFVLSALSEQR
jgi:hypothetical protein